MPPGSAGKADGVSILKGSDIPSQYVDASKYYLTGRSIDSLRTVGALTSVQDKVAARADGIIANLAANDRIDAAELVRMEEASIFASLFPDEQAALPTLWAHMVAPAPGAATVASPFTNIAPVEKRTEPGGLTPPASLAISSLPTELQAVAKRVQLLFNSDSNASTIQQADIDQVIVMPAAFTPAEVNQLREIIAIFHERSTSVEDATLVVPAPGHKETTTHVGSIALKLEEDLVLHETRTIRVTSYGMDDWSGKLFIERTAKGSIEGGGDHVILIPLGETTEHVVTGASAELPALPAGTLVVERYVGGQRQQTHAIAMPAVKPGQEDIDLKRFLDYTLVLATNAPLV
jgi:hypothetical protein